MIIREHFYKTYKEKFSKLNQPKVDALNFILDKLDKSKKFSLASEYAYILATIKLECNDTYLPVAEGYWIKSNRKKALYKYYAANNPGALRTIFPNGASGISYEGRGFVQCTHNFNYAEFTKLLKINLTGKPDLAMEPETAWKICEIGMYKGIFTKKKLSEFVNESKTDYRNARRVINGLDRAEMIAGYARDFYDCIEFN